MRPRTNRIYLLATVTVVACVAAATGPLEALCVCCALLAVWCALYLFDQTRVNRPKAAPCSSPAPRHAEDESRPEHPKQEENVLPPVQEHHDSTTESQELRTLEDRSQDESKEEPQASLRAASNAAKNEPAKFDYHAFALTILTSPAPFDVLRKLVEKALADLADDPSTVHPVEAFLAHELSQTGLLGDEVLPDSVGVVFPRHSKLFYIRMPGRSLTYGTVLDLLRIESVLNAVLFCNEHYDDLNAIAEEDIYRVWQRITASISAHAPEVDTADWSYLAMPWQVPYGPTEQGEWSVRQAISEAIETVRVPHRLEAHFRCNVAGGDVAIEFKATPARVFSRHAWTSGLGIVPTTRQMRAREASRYAARVGLLLAAHAFHASNRIRRVWVTAVEETPRTHACLYSVHIDRRTFSHLRRDGADPIQTLVGLGADLRLVGEELQPITSSTYLEDQRFCPPHRYDLWRLSERSLPPSAVIPLGCSRVSGLLIHEQLPRDVIADAMMRAINSREGTDVGDVQHAVRAILSTAHSTSDMSVWSAAERVANKLVEGSLEVGKTDALVDEFVEGDSLTKALQSAQNLIVTQRPHEAMSILLKELEPLEAEGRYHDSRTVAYKSFDTFTERVLYNRMNAEDSRTIELVPDAYTMAHLTLCALYASLPTEDGGNLELALAHSERALEVAPLSAPANLSVAACLDSMGKDDEAIGRLSAYLDVSHQAQPMGLAYFRLAPLLWRTGQHDAAIACFYQAIRVFPPLLPFAMASFQSLGGEEDLARMGELDEQGLERALEAAGVPVAPTQRTAFYLFDGATASVDAEVFPVARDLLMTLEALTGDDVLHGIRMSLEHEPDS